MRKIFLTGVGLLTAAFAANAAQSALVVTLASIDQVSNGYRYTYNIVLTGGSGLSASAPSGFNNGQTYPSQLTIFDFGGYVANSISVDSFDSATTGGTLTASTSLTTGGLLMNPGDTDDATLTNLNFAYSGSTYNVATDLAIGAVSAVSTYNQTRTTSYSGIDVKNANGAAEFFTTTTRAPVGEVPEAATWAMMVLGFGIIGMGSRSRRSAPVVTFD